MKYNFPFHLVTMSPWPLFSSFSLMIIFISLLNLFINYSFMNMFMGLILMLFIMFIWWRDVIRESTFQGYHTMKVMNGMRLGMLLFIISEVFFFISFFWTYYHMTLSPSIDLGFMWPPKGIILFNPFNVPLLNTIILLSSGLTVTWCHYSMLSGDKYSSELSLLITVFLGGYFSMFQFMEYNNANFTIADSVFGSIFYMVTGFHGIHVLIGTIFLLVSLIRMYNNHYSSYHHFGFEGAAWYWHFVDLIWLFLFLSLYWWPY
uniref:Cytochrome c oxidase subunit 3 n=1 Tax=Ettchellsia sinica TaxID=1738633 RepID=A0A2S0B8H8_9HYME|nr:cytochrome c oxidase subunit III [Ettchellsia sinica]